MQPEIVTALIAAIVSVLGSGVTLLIGLRSLRNERDKLQIEYKRLLVEKEKFQSELRESARQARVWEAEVERLRAETDKLAMEADEIRRRRIEAERAEIRDLLILFDRAVFNAPMQSEEPVEMFKAIRQTRIALQTSGASLVRDREVAEHFQKTREVLLRVETEVAQRYPVIAQLANEPEKDRPVYERRKQAQEILGRDFYEPIRMMMNTRQEIQYHIEKIRNRLHELDARIGS